jgi:hypothetical protein
MDRLSLKQAAVYWKVEANAWLVSWMICTGIRRRVEGKKMLREWNAHLTVLIAYGEPVGTSGRE